MEEEDVAERTRKERADIVRKYDIGREEGAVIDPWEDPDFEVYTHTDRYGFMHDRPIPEVPSEIAAKARDLEVERTTKWLKMIRSWDKYLHSDKLSKRVYKGIPHAMRGEVWARLLDVTRVRQEQDGVYETMRVRSRLYSNDVRQIDLDVNRTYRNHVMFRERYGVKQQSLFHVLAAYSMYNTEVGYCQGMSQIGALLLMYLNTEEDAFWALSVLMSDRTHAMHGFFIPGFPKLKRFNEHHDKLLKKLLPKVKKMLDKHMIDVSLYTMKWYFQCFLDRAPFSLCLRLWDAYILDGERVLVAMGYLLMKLHKKNILKGQFEDVMRLLNDQLVNDFGYDDDAVMAQLQGTMEDLRRSKLDLPPKGKQNETPAMPFGLFTEPKPTTAIATKTNDKERHSLSVAESGTTSPSTPQPMEREESESRTPSPAYKGSSKAVNSLSARSPSFPTDVSHETTNSSTPSAGVPRFFQHQQQQQQQSQQHLRAELTSLTSASDLDDSRVSKAIIIDNHSETSVAVAGAAAASSRSPSSMRSPTTDSATPTPTLEVISPSGGRDRPPSWRGSEYDNDGYSALIENGSGVATNGDVAGVNSTKDSIEDYADVEDPNYEGEMELNLERRTAATGSPWEDGFSRDFDGSLRSGPMTPMGVSPAKERRLPSGTPAKASPLKGTPIPIVLETDVLTTNPPKRTVMTTSMMPDTVSAIPIVEDVFREQVMTSVPSTSRQYQSQDNQSLQRRSQQEDHQQQQQHHSRSSSSSQSNQKRLSSSSETYYQTSSSTSQQTSTTTRVPNSRHIAVAEASTVNPQPGKKQGAAVIGRGDEEDAHTLVAPQKITYGEWKVSTMIKTSPTHPTGPPSIKGGGGDEEGEVDETIDYPVVTDSASLRLRQKQMGSESRGGGGGGGNYVNGQADSTRSSVSSSQRSPLSSPAPDSDPVSSPSAFSSSSTVSRPLPTYNIIPINPAVSADPPALYTVTPGTPVGTVIPILPATPTSSPTAAVAASYPIAATVIPVNNAPVTATVIPVVPAPATTAIPIISAPTAAADSVEGVAIRVDYAKSDQPRSPRSQRPKSTPPLPPSSAKSSSLPPPPPVNFGEEGDDEERRGNGGNSLLSFTLPSLPISNESAAVTSTTDKLLSPNSFATPTLPPITPTARVAPFHPTALAGDRGGVVVSGGGIVIGLPSSPSPSPSPSPALPPSRIPVVDRSLKKTSSIEKRSAAKSEEGSRAHHHHHHSHYHHQSASGRVPPKIPWSTSANELSSTFNKNSSTSHLPSPPSSPSPLQPSPSPSASSSSRGIRPPRSAIPPPSQIPRGPSPRVTKSPSADSFMAGGASGSRTSLHAGANINNNYNGAAAAASGSGSVSISVENGAQRGQQRPDAGSRGTGAVGGLAETADRRNKYSPSTAAAAPSPSSSKGGKKSKISAQVHAYI